MIDVSAPTPAVRKRILGPLEEADAKTSRDSGGKPTESDEEVEDIEIPEGTPKPDTDK